MQQILTEDKTDVVLNGITYLVGSKDTILGMERLAAKEPFDAQIIDFLNALSKRLMGMREAKAYPDIITLGFWLRKSSVLKLKERFIFPSEDVRLGRGTAFHIAPSNVAVNYAYSLAAGLLTGNANIVRIPSRKFPQIDIINRAICEELKMQPEVGPYICLVRYEKDKKINDFLSLLADTRIIWGGDNTIAQLRQSPIRPRANEVAFADRYSLAIIDSDSYLRLESKERFAEDFYNDTFLTDQNACTSPRIVIWTGKQKAEAKEIFWELEHALVKTKYNFQPIMGINKLTSGYLAAAALENIKIVPSEDNYIIRVSVPEAKPSLMNLKDNSGYFFEYDCDDIMQIRDFCDNTHCQTIGYLGAMEDLMPLLKSGIKGVDRVVPIGKTMDFDLIWDGYNLAERLTRTIKINVRNKGAR